MYGIEMLASLQCSLYLTPFGNGIETLYITQLKFEIEISGRGVYMLNLRRQRVQRPHELANFKIQS